MALKEVVKVSRKTFFNPTGWLGYNMLKSQFSTTWNILKSLYSPAQPTREETFAAAMQRLALTEEDIAFRAQRFLIYAVIFTVCGIFTLGFSAYLLFHHGTFAGLILGLVTAVLFFAYAFRFSFWRFQIKQRKLGCTFDEWLYGKVNNSGDSPHD